MCSAGLNLQRLPKYSMMLASADCGSTFHCLPALNYLMSDIIIASVCTLTPEKEYGAGAGCFCRLRHYEY